MADPDKLVFSIQTVEDAKDIKEVITDIYDYVDYTPFGEPLSEEEKNTLQKIQDLIPSAITELNDALSRFDDDPETCELITSMRDLLQYTVACDVSWTLEEDKKRVEESEKEGK
ncbi:hypothetical protein F5Y13DRAFT_184427 [Hypoxylon sp. FL1857]|nr:hypothetical protein F5Y13DRAFT_184427 [Hypoxylon sp. FL1857]